MDLTEIVEENIKELPIYDLSFSEDDYRRYYQYENETQGNESKRIGICRKCRTKISRANSSTNGMFKHIKACDPNAWELLEKRKTRSISLSPSRNVIKPINTFFEVSNYFNFEK
jgi:hypothetical protein